jgi:hypothetical protein
MPVTAGSVMLQRQQQRRIPLKYLTLKSEAGLCGALRQHLVLIRM